MNVAAYAASITLHDLRCIDKGSIVLGSNSLPFQTGLTAVLNTPIIATGILIGVNDVVPSTPILEVF